MNLQLLSGVRKTPHLENATNGEVEDAAAALLAVAALVVHLPNGFFWTARGLEYPLMWAVLCVACVLRGSGPLSVDSARGRDA